MRAIRSRRLTMTWRRSVDETNRLEDEHQRKHPMVYGWLSHRFHRPWPRGVPMLRYEWRKFTGLMS